MLTNFCRPGKASFLLGGQWGSEGKGAAAAFVAAKLAERGEYFNILTTNAGCQSGHTSIHKGKKRVTFHLPTATLVMQDLGCTHMSTYLNAGSVINPTVLLQELDEHGMDDRRLFIHPNAAIITPDCTIAESRNDSAQTVIASTRKGVGEALSRKVLRSGEIARNCSQLRHFIRRIDLNAHMYGGKSVLVEVPQGVSLSLNGRFWPHSTSRDCTVMQAMSDAHVHPSFYGATVMVIRTFPIRVGNIVDGETTIGQSGPCYHDQNELTWEVLGVDPEITTVTKRVRRVFTFSRSQLIDAMTWCRPDFVLLTFCDYIKEPYQAAKIGNTVAEIATSMGIPAPEMLYAYGPSTEDVYDVVQLPPSENAAMGA